MSYDNRFRFQFREILIIIVIWIISLNLYIIIRYYGISELSGSFFTIERIAFRDFYLLALIGGVAIGFFTGIFEIFFYPEALNKRSFVMVVIFKSLFYLIVLLGVILITTFFYFLIKEFSVLHSLEKAKSFVSTESFVSLMTYLSIVSLVINYIRLISNKFGPSVHWNMVFGKYHKPKEEELIFMFLDLKSSTSIAERLGHIKFSSFLQDYFRDLSLLVVSYRAQIYQYVGDEAVVTWTLKGGLSNVNCIRFFYAFERRILRRKSYYIRKYGFEPEFKASLNVGTVTVAEVGEYKSEIAYHGDVVNTASRLQEQCNKFGKKLLISEHLHKYLKDNPALNKEFIDRVILKGKEKPISIYSVELVGL